MNAILFQKQKNSEITPMVIDSEVLGSQIYNKVARSGCVTIISSSDSEIFIPRLIQKFHFKKMEQKARKVELYRALKFDKPVYHELSRIIEVDYPDAGAFKRSFTPFFRSRYLETMAPCVLIIPEKIHVELMLEKNRKDYIDTTEKKIANLDPFLKRWLDEMVQSNEINVLGRDFIGESLSATLVRALILKASQSDSPVMLIGETGTGKNLIARMIHDHSLRKVKPFVSVNCSAVSEQEFAALLYGKHCSCGNGETKDSPGLLQRAENGTLFLDEIGELSLRNQTELLNSLETWVYSPAAKNESKDYNVRIIASTNSNLALKVRLKAFRENLFYRLNSIQIIIPPLRDRTEDIPLLAQEIWGQIAEKRNPLNHNFLAYLQKKTWPGNMREMKMVLENLANVFNELEPSQYGLESLQKLRNDQGMFQRDEINDYYNTLQHEYKNRLAQSMRVIRGIRVKLRPLINDDRAVINNATEVHKIRVFVQKQTDVLGEFLLDPLYFKDQDLYDQIRCFRFDLDEALKMMPAVPETFPVTWQTNFQDKYEDILHRIFKLVWSEERG